MHSAWHILRWAWSAVTILYLVLATIADRRLHGGEKKLNHAILIVIAVSVAVRIWILHALGGRAYRLAVVVFGVAAGIAALIVAKMLMSQTQDGEAEVGESKERIQSLKLN